LVPSELSKLMSNASVQQKQSLSAAECAFYDRLVDECAQYIVDHCCPVNLKIACAFEVFSIT